MRKYTNEVKLGTFILIVLAILAYLSIRIGRWNVGEDIKCKAVFDNAAGLVDDAAVMVAGVRIGTVTKLSVEHNKAALALSLRSDAKIRKDVKATIRMKSLLGEKYVELVPQSTSAPLLQSNDVITDTSVPSEIDELVDRLASIAAGLSEKHPDGANFIEETAKLVRLIRETMENSREALPELVCNMRDATSELKNLLAENRSEARAAIRDVRKLSGDIDSLVKENRAPLAKVIANAQAISTEAREHAPTVAGNLRKLSANLATASERLPAIMQRIDSLSAKLDQTVDVANELLIKANAIDSYALKKFLQEDGITINLFKKKITEEGEVKEPVFELDE